nr:MAG TPA: hypothetical protein [Caudoviricetes sp.]
MQELTTINNAEILVKEFSGQRVVTFKEIDAVHGRPDGTAKRNFRSNRDHFIEGEDFFILDQPDEIRSLGIQRPQGGTPESVTLITESGYLMLVKSFTDDLAWKVQRELVKGYFRAKSSDPQFSTLSPQLQALINIEMRQHEQERQMNELALKVQQNSDTMDKVTAAYVAPISSGDNWQESANHTINALVEHFCLNHQMFRRELYEELERESGCDLQQRLTRLKNRMKAAGATVTQCRTVTKLTIISQDKKLRSIFIGILRRRTLEFTAAENA